jgi:hypothetical protein
MRATKIILDDKAVYLRLSAAKLAEYAKVTDSSGNTLFAVMDALDDLQKQAALFEAALNFKGNSNEIHDGFELIDMLADADYGPLDTKELIVRLAEGAGMIGKVDSAKLVSAIKAGNEKLYKVAVAVLTGDASELAETEADHKAEEAEENPT